jgi:hypothetical protein
MSDQPSAASAVDEAVRTLRATWTKAATSAASNPEYATS